MGKQEDKENWLKHFGDIGNLAKDLSNHAGDVIDHADKHFTKIHAAVLMFVQNLQEECLFRGSSGPVSARKELTFLMELFNALLKDPFPEYMEKIENEEIEPNSLEKFLFANPRTEISLGLTAFMDYCRGNGVEASLYQAFQAIEEIITLYYSYGLRFISSVLGYSHNGTFYLPPRLEGELSFEEMNIQNPFAKEAEENE